VELCCVCTRTLVGVPHAWAADTPTLSWQRVWFFHTLASWGWHVWFSHVPAPWRWCLMYVPSLHGFQHSEPCCSGFFSPTCWLDARSSLGKGWCSAHRWHPSIMCMQQCCPSIEYLNIWGSTSLTSASVFIAMSSPSFVHVNAQGCASVFTAMPPLVCTCQHLRIEFPCVWWHGSSISGALPHQNFESTLSIQPDL